MTVQTNLCRPGRNSKLLVFSHSGPFLLLANECYTLSGFYKGRRTCTRLGRTCQRWDSQSPTSHIYTSASHFPDATVSAAGKYCRDPQGGMGKPWCYIASPATSGDWDYCDVPHCSCMLSSNSFSFDFSLCMRKPTPWVSIRSDTFTGLYSHKRQLEA